MSNPEILQTITTIIRDVLELPDLKVTTDTSAADVDEWDSMTHLQLISAIEGKYKVRFALGELQALKNVGDMIGLIEKKLNK
ncbi:MAG: acyl carrier protein [Bdellovibrionales bacterium]|nr:acyl carrier protein [Bdellovibrionales bacterium]